MKELIKALLLNAAAQLAPVNKLDKPQREEEFDQSLQWQLHKRAYFSLVEAMKVWPDPPVIEREMLANKVARTVVKKEAEKVKT